MKTLRCSYLLQALLTLALAGGTTAQMSVSSAAPADCDPRRPIASLPYTIDRAGSYLVTDDLVQAGGSGILIAANDVTLDLGGHTLTGTGGIAAIRTDGTRINLVVRNGQLHDWGATAIDFDLVIGAVVEDVTISGSSFAGLQAIYATRLSRCRLAGNARGAIVGNFALVDDTTFADNTDVGAILDEAIVLRDSIAEGNGLTGFGSPARSVVARCSATDNASASGFKLTEDVVMVDSVASRNGAHGVDVGVRNVVVGCAAHDNSGTGIWGVGQVEVPRLIADNVATGNGANGFQSSNHALLRGNTASENGDHGIEVSAENYVVGNILYDNVLDGVLATSARNRIDGNNTSQNTRGVVTNATFNVVVRNKATLNVMGNYDLALNSFIGPLAASIGVATAWSNFQF